MRLLRLALENWRGVPSREIEFSGGVTLIEGPNEIGKSTIVEALHTLIAELDSSKKKTVTAIQPVGQDVGSRVEAEIITGDYHFVYAKTYNKDKQTELRILAPKVEQLTGREAHERAEKILRDTVDMALWDALLVEQGKEVAGASLADSHGLARALDEAAGSASPEQEDSDLYSSVQAEYEKYLTLKTGTPRFATLKKELDAARSEFDAARDALTAIETDSDDHARCVVEIRRLEGELPELREKVAQREASWQTAASLQQMVNFKQKELDTAQQFLDTSLEVQGRRKQLADDLVATLQLLNKKREQVAPLADQAKELKTASAQADVALKAARAGLKQARAAVELARADQQHLLALGALEAEEQRLERLRHFTEQAAAERATLAAININANGLQELHQAESDFQVANGRLNTATSAIEITAEQDLSLALDDEQLGLAAGEVEQRNIAAELRVVIPGVASIRVTPSLSATELEAEFAEYGEVLSGLLEKYSVKDLADAVATEAKRADADRDLKAWIDKSNELLGDDAEAEVRARVASLHSACTAYDGDRVKEPAMPDDAALAAKQTRGTETALQVAEQESESLQADCERLREDYRQADADQRVAAQELAGLEQDHERKQQQLDEARTAAADDAVDARVVEKAAIVEAEQEELKELRVQLEAASPESAETLLTNARDVRDRAEHDSRDQSNQLLVLEDRLTRAQANGRFEALEVAERELEELESRYESTAARAAAAERLWQTLNKHRDEMRKAYVQPLKDGIERLGRIVFGEDFSVELGEDWTLVSRTLGNKTLPFDDLSIGAKEQLGILTRLAAARIVSSQGGVPLIIDDALGFSDPGRLESMGAVIASAGKECQIILLTCTPGRFMHVGSAEVVRF